MSWIEFFLKISFHEMLLHACKSLHLSLLEILDTMPDEDIQSVQLFPACLDLFFHVTSLVTSSCLVVAVKSLE